jgi:hypothetical protein
LYLFIFLLIPFETILSLSLSIILNLFRSKWISRVGQKSNTQIINLNKTFILFCKFIVFVIKISWSISHTSCSLPFWLVLWSINLIHFMNSIIFQNNFICNLHIKHKLQSICISNCHAKYDDSPQHIQVQSRRRTLTSIGFIRLSSIFTDVLSDFHNTCYSMLSSLLISMATVWNETLKCSCMMCVHAPLHVIRFRHH